MTTFTNLPAQTRFIRLVSDARQATEGIRLHFGGSVPEPTTMLLLVAAALTALRRRA